MLYAGNSVRCQFFQNTGQYAPLTEKHARRIDDKLKIVFQITPRVEKNFHVVLFPDGRRNCIGRRTDSLRFRFSAENTDEERLF